TPRASGASLTGAAVLAGAPARSGCAVQKTVSGWFHKGEPSSSSEAATGAGQKYYASEAGLKVYSEPTSSSKVVGKLSLHEKVTRFKVDRGYAYVKADASGLAGWVNNSMLLWRPPAAEPAPAAPPARGTRGPRRGRAERGSGDPGHDTIAGTLSGASGEAGAGRHSNAGEDRALGVRSVLNACAREPGRATRRVAGRRRSGVASTPGIVARNM